jgi:PAS domain S-box-containing protein
VALLYIVNREARQTLDDRKRSAWKRAWERQGKPPLLDKDAHFSYVLEDTFMEHLPPLDAGSTPAELQVEDTDLGTRLATPEATLDDSLRVREQQALLILNEMYQFVALLDAQGNELETNQTSLDAVGLRREDCIGRPFWEIPVWPDSIIQDLQESFQHVITTGEFMRFEAEFFAPGNEQELLTTDITLKPIRDAQNEVAFVVLEGRDISERKRAEAEVARKNAELQALYDQLHKLDQLKSMFYAMMNHDLRAPLTLILVPAESLLQASLDPKVRKTLEMVVRNARLLLNLVNDLLEVSRLEQGKFELHYESCDLSRLVNRLSANFETLATEQQFTFRVQTPSHLQVEIDPARIERVVLNLLSNAFKFTPPGGGITCCLETEPASGDAPEMPAQVLLTVQDSGPGVPADLREMIFEPFRQVEKGTRRRKGGSGLGLAIVKDLVSLHGGTVRVDEASGGGARFTVRLPRHPPAGTHVQHEDNTD